MPRMSFKDEIRGLLGHGKQTLVAGGIGDPKLHVPGLPGPQDLPRATQLQILAGNLETVAALAQDRQPRPRLG